MSRPFDARYSGRCAAECGQSLQVGDQVVYEDDELVHGDCVEKLNQSASRPACPSCWTIHAGECM